MLTTTYKVHLCPTKEQMSKNVSDNDLYNIARVECRTDLPKTTQLINFNRNNRGVCNFRDGPILGKYPGVSIPSSVKKGEMVLLSVFLNHTVDDNVLAKFQSNYKMPPLFNKQDIDINDRFRNKNPVGGNQQWISAERHTVCWKKRPWELSRNFRNMVGMPFPTFSIVLTPYVDGILQHEESVQTTAFEICSKEQPKTSNFERGDVTVTTKRRRTPESERAHEKLRSVQAELLRLRDEIEKHEQIAGEYRLRLTFGLTIARSESSAQQLVTKIETGEKHITRIFKKH